MSEAVREVAPEELLGRADEVREVFRAALGYPPMESRVVSLGEVIARHARREHFRALAAYSGDRLVGFTYGCLGAPGQWWHDQVARALGPAGRTRWLDGAFELVELHVHPEFQGRGLGGALHDRLLEGVTLPTAVLSTRRQEGSAMALYRRRGWRVLVEDMRFPGVHEAFRIMGLDLGS